MQTPHLNPHGCEIRAAGDKGRGVFASREIAPQTTIDISPVLFFAADEYAAHGRHTVLDHYTFKWRDGRMALALGLGSLFNHAAAANVSYTLDTAAECIRFTTLRRVAAGEELCIFYGETLWFADAAGAGGDARADADEDAWEGLAAVALDAAEDAADPEELVAAADLPFARVGGPPADDDDDEAETMDAWVVDIPDARDTAAMIQWLRPRAHPALKHAKHVRKWTDPHTSAARTTLLLAPADAPPPAVPGGLAPYVLPVPRHPARTRAQVARKGALWPVFLEARDHAAARADAQRWTRAAVQAFRDAVRVLRTEAARARALGELPIAAYVPGAAGAAALLAHDTRASTGHPLRHAVFNVVRAAAADGGGGQYLLTGRTLFTTHEPCIACSMALLHSRVREVVFVHAMPATGGCGGAARVAGLRGVNHRYGVWQWRRVPAAGAIAGDVDA